MCFICCCVRQMFPWVTLKENDQTKMRKPSQEMLPPEITEMPIRTGLVLSEDLRVSRNMIGFLLWVFYFTNYRHGRFARGYKPHYRKKGYTWGPFLFSKVQLIASYPEKSLVDPNGTYMYLFWVKMVMENRHGRFAPGYKPQTSSTIITNYQTWN